MPIQHILFDNDGTIVDSEIIAIRSILRHMRGYGLVMDEKEYSLRFPGLLERDILHIMRTEYQLDIPDNFLEATRAEHIDLLNRELRVIPGMAGLFRKVRVPKSMVSNGSIKHVVRSLKKVRLLTALDGHIFSAEQVERPKPHPDVYHFALETLQLMPSEVLVVEDSPTGVDAAKRAGLKVVGFLGAAHVCDGHAEKLLSLGADYIASNAKELGQIFDSHGAF
ncbi:MAG: HAD family phosphatase [Lewinellaceae bacterium]|nr:HAD family phosphatase [Lewinellaceae bacterium]